MSTSSIPPIGKYEILDKIGEGGCCSRPLGALGARQRNRLVDKDF